MNPVLIDNHPHSLMATIISLWTKFLYSIWIPFTFPLWHLYIHVLHSSR